MNDQPRPRRVCDSHHHLWDLDALHYPWLSQPVVHPLPGLGDIAPIQVNYLADDFLADTRSIPLEATIHVQAEARGDLALDEIAWLTDVAATNPRGIPTGLVGFVDLGGDDARDILSRYAAMGRVVGIRQILNWDDDNPKWRFAERDFLAEPRWRENFALAVDAGLAFDAQVWPSQFAAVADLAQRTGARVVIDHCGMPLALSGPPFEAWRDALRVFRTVPDIAMKFSGLTMIDRHWTADTARPVFDAILDVFGPDRILFGSNFPVDRIGKTYDAIVDHVSTLCHPHGEMLTDKIFYRNGMQFYGLAP